LSPRYLCNLLGIEDRQWLDTAINSKNEQWLAIAVVTLNPERNAVTKAATSDIIKAHPGQLLEES